MTSDTSRCLAITGTDTGIGKTVVSCALLARARQLGLRVAAMKPVESGIDERPVVAGRVRSDADRLREAAACDEPLAVIRPYVLEEPLAPLVAARRAGVHVDLAVLDAARQRLLAGRDLLVVEGAGGLLVPITADVAFDDLFARWGCGLVIVAGNRLGALNHVLLTVQAAAAAGLAVEAVVLTDLADRDPSVAEATNYDALRLLLPTHRILRFPWVDRTDDLDALAVAARGAGLDTLLAPPVAAATLSE